MRLIVARFALLAPLAVSLSLAACVKYQSLDWLGPPSQIIAIGEQRVFYYLSQKQSGQAKVLIVWNDAEDQTRYDRAVFFFDPEGVLTEYSIRDEASAGK